MNNLVIFFEDPVEDTNEGRSKPANFACRLFAAPQAIPHDANRRTRKLSHSPANIRQMPFAIKRAARAFGTRRFAAVRPGGSLRAEN
ncbi:hypothetical protein D3C73_1325100 [compost metagenome]